MKCPTCRHNQKYSHGMTCGSCGYRFLLNPKKRGRITDGFMHKALRLASCGDTVRFTENQLYAAARQVNEERSAKRQRQGGWAMLAIFAAILGLVLIGLCFQFWLQMVFAFPLSFGLLGSFLSFLIPGRYLKRTAWDTVLATWRRGGGALPGLIDIEGRELATPPSAPADGDVFDYGFGQLLICQHEALVDSLVLNGFHTENACMVMAESGYPEYLRGRVVEELQRNPDLAVFLWHDASEEGEGMGERLRSANSALPLGDGREVIDLGVKSAEVARGKRLKKLRKANGGSFPADLLTHARCAGVLGMAMADYATLGAVEDGSVEGAMELLESSVLKRSRREGAGDGGGGGGEHVVSWEVSWEDSCESDADGGDGDGE